MTPLQTIHASGSVRLYRLYGLIASSCIPLAEASPTDGNITADVTIREGRVPEKLVCPEKRYPFWEAQSGDLLMRIPGIARIRAQNGNSIIFERLPDASDEQVCAYLLGTGFAAILHQRGTAVLHAAGVARAGSAFLVCGTSGAGKSTTAAHLVEREGSLLCDDLAAIDTRRECAVHPGLLRTRLDAGALASVGRTGVGPICARGKWAIPVADPAGIGPTPLGGVLIVEHSTEPAMELQRLRPAVALRSLRRHSFRRNFVTRDRAQAILDTLAGVADRVPVWQLSRPRGADTMKAVADLAEQAIRMSVQTEETVS